MATQIPLVIALWEHPDYGGRKRVIVEDTKDLDQTSFNDKTSAVGVHPGPDYAAWKTANGGKEPEVGLYEHINYGGACLRLTVGGYRNISRLFNFNDAISSVKINPPPPGAHQIAPISLIVEIYEHDNYKGRRLVVVENSYSITNEFGSDFNDITTSVRVRPGPNYAQGMTAKLYRDNNYQGGMVELGVGDYPNIGASHGFNDVISSIKVR